VRERGEELRHALAELPRVREVRGRGFMLAVEIDGGGAPELVLRALTEARLVLNATGPETLRILPPLVISDAELDDALGRLRSLLAAA
jgi:acetylornithine aminotransferase/acetylornithine/N-succinyldiaminopimelate aminotransferase